MRHKPLFWIVSLFLGMLLSGCIGDMMTEPRPLTIRPLNVQEKEIIRLGNQFGIKLLQEIADQEEERNFFISPLSVFTALTMTLNGSSGTTETAMRGTLEFGSMSFNAINNASMTLMELLTLLDEDVKFDIANSIWYRTGFEVEPRFIRLNQDYFNALVKEVDFTTVEAPEIINHWVDENTHGKIKQIIDRIDEATVMFIINAIYFKGDWAAPFDENQTIDASFYRSDGSAVSCRTMRKISQFAHFATDDFQAIDLPYGNGKFSMVVILPDPDESVDKIIREITHDKWNQWMSFLSQTTIDLEFPKFILEYEILLNDALADLGMEIAFDPERADFTRINPHGGLYISKVKHKTFVEVDEKGTEAAAVTSVDVGLTSMPPSVKVNRPFLFAIREHHSNSILFIGKVEDPTIRSY